MLRLFWRTGRAYHAALCYAPTNRLISRLRERHTLKRAVLALMLGATYVYAAAVCTVLIDRGVPGWLHGLVFLFIWNGFKFTVYAPVSILTIVKTRLTVMIRRRRYRRTTPVAGWTGHDARQPATQVALVPHQPHQVV